MKTNLHLLLKLTLSCLCFAMTFQSVAQDNLALRSITGNLKAEYQQTFIIKHNSNQTLPIAGEYGQLCITEKDSVTKPIPVRFQSVTGFIIVCRRLVDESEIKENDDSTNTKTWVIITSKDSTQLANSK